MNPLILFILLLLLKKQNKNQIIAFEVQEALWKPVPIAEDKK